MTVPGLRWLRSDPAEDRALSEMQWPRSLDAGIPILGLALTVLVLAAALLAGHGSHRPHLMALVLVALSGVPWLYRMPRPASPTVGPAPRTWRYRLFPVGVLVPLALLDLAGWIFDLDLGSPVAYQLLLFPVLLTVALQILCRPRRTAALVVAAGLAVLLLGASRWATRLPAVGFDWTGVISQTVGFAFAVCAATTVRQISLALHQAGQALARQSAAEERRRLARDVHDVVAHTLSITMLHVTAARMAVDKGEPAAAADALQDAERHGRASLGDLRRAVRLLRDDAGATHAPQPQMADIDALVDGYRAAGLDIDQTVAGDLRRVSPAAALVLYQVLQEALANAVRHGDSPAVVDLRIDGDEVALEVANPVATRSREPGAGSGLLGMRERVEGVGGTVATGREGTRWAVTVRLPVVAATQAESPNGAGVDEGERASEAIGLPRGAPR